MSKSRSAIRKNLRLLEKVRSDYYPVQDEFNYIPPPVRDQSEINNTATPQSINFHIDDETGKMVIEGNRYLRLGKIQLYDSLDDEYLSSRKFIAILDTQTQTLHCFDVEKLYDEYIVSEKQHAHTKFGTFNLSDSTRSMVLGEMFKTQ